MTLYRVKFDDGSEATRLREEPDAGETIAATAELARELVPWEAFDWETGEIAGTAEALEAYLLQQVDARRADLSEPLLPSDPAKVVEYLRKGTEALSDIGPWPWLQRLAEARDTDIETIRLEVIDAMEQQDAALQQIAAVAQAAKVAIRAAGTIEDKHAAFDAIEWPVI